MREITIQQFIEGYAERMISEVVYIKDRVYGINVKGQASNPQRYEVVYAVVP